MSISSVTTTPPVTVPVANEPKQPQVQNDDVSSRTPQAPQAALPPGQGTRVNQLC